MSKYRIPLKDIPTYFDFSIEMRCLKYCTLLSKESMFQKSLYEIGWLYHIKKLKSACLNGRTDFLVTIIELLCFLNFYRNHHQRFEMYRTILTWINILRELTHGRTDPNYRVASLLKMWFLGFAMYLMYFLSIDEKKTGFFGISFWLTWTVLFISNIETIFISQ